MPTWINHFRVVDTFLDKLCNINLEYFLIGTIAPDCGMPTGVSGQYIPPSSVTHFAKKLSKTDCDYKYVYNTFVKNEKDEKKRAFFLAYSIHLFEDSIFAKSVFKPIEDKYGDFRTHDDVRKRFSFERNTVDMMFLSKNTSPSFELFKKCKPFCESYPEWYEKGVISARQRDVSELYENPTFEKTDFKYVTPEIIDRFITVTSQLVPIEFKDSEIFE